MLTVLAFAPCVAELGLLPRLSTRQASPELGCLMCSTWAAGYPSWAAELVGCAPL